MGLFDWLFGAKPAPPPPVPSWRSALYDGGLDVEREFSATLVDGRLHAVYARVEHDDPEFWIAAFGDEAFQSVERLLLTGVSVQSLASEVQYCPMPALRTLVLGAVEGMGNAEYSAEYLLQGGTQGRWNALSTFAPMLEELVAHDVVAIGELPATLRRLTWLSFEEGGSEEALDIGPSGTLSCLEELTLFKVPVRSLLDRDDLQSLRILRLGEVDVEEALGQLVARASALTSLQRVEIYVATTLYQSTVDAIVEASGMPCEVVLCLLEDVQYEPASVDDAFDMRGLTVEDAEPYAYALRMPG